MVSPELSAEGCTLTEVAGLAGRDIATLSSAARKLRAKAMADSRNVEERRMILENANMQA